MQVIVDDSKSKWVIKLNDSGSNKPIQDNRWTEPGQSHSTADQQKKQFDRPSWKGILKNPRYVMVGSVALFAFVLIVTFIIVSKRGEQHQSGERAWLAVQEATIVGPLVQHNIPTATVLLKNTGHSPALTTKAHLVMTVWTSNRFPDWDMPLQLTTDAETMREIGPGSVVPQAVSLIAPLTDVQGMHLERKDWFIVILGIVSYVDTLGHPHETKLCLIWRETSAQHLSSCEKWNEAD